MPISKQNRRARQQSKKRADSKIAEHEANGGFIYWRDQPNIVHIPFGYWQKWRIIQGKVRYIEQTDTMTGKKWLVQQDPESNMIHTRKPQTSFLDSDGQKVYVHEDRYTREQYDLIRVAIWYMVEKEWKAKWVYNLLTHPSVNFPQYPGQTPLTSRKVQVWKMEYRANLVKGILWP